MQEFINLRQGDMILKEYTLKFTQLSKYAPAMVVDSKAKIKKFDMGISDLLVNEYSSAMLIHSMDISHLMVHADKFRSKSLNK